MQAKDLPAYRMEGSPIWSLETRDAVRGKKKEEKKKRKRKEKKREE
jgi:hypothetical protein